MSKSLMILSGLALLVLVPAVATATHIETLIGEADCEGWNASATVYWRWDIYTGNLDYSVVLLDSDGNEVARDEWSGEITRGDEREVIYTYEGAWDMELCGDYTVVGTLHLIAPTNFGVDEESTREFTAAFTCDCDEPGDCFLTPGYWKNHAKNWPQDTLVLGGIAMSQKDLIKILKTSVKGGDATVILAHHLIAAKLNVLNGADDSIQSVIDDADAYLADHPVSSNPGEDEGRQYALDLKDMLADYNEQGCPEEDDYDEEEPEKSATTTESVSWDKMKALYR